MAEFNGLLSYDIEHNYITQHRVIQLLFQYDLNIWPIAIFKSLQ
jgi:hypothetical protein